MQEESRATQATVSVGRRKIVIGLPFEIHRSGADKLVCRKDNLSRRLRLFGINSSRVEQVLGKCFEECEDFVDVTELGGFSIEIPFTRHVPESQREGVGETLKRYLHDSFGFDVRLIPLNEYQNVESTTAF